MITLAIIVGGLSLVGITLAILIWGKLPPWTHRDLLAFLALVATIGGAMILTYLKWTQTESFNAQADRLVTELVRERPSQLSDAVGQTLTTIIETMSWDQKLTSAGIIVVLLSLGLVISARTLKGKIFGSEFEMNTASTAAAAATAARATADAADDKATKIAETGAAPPLAPPIDAAPTSRK